MNPQQALLQANIATWRAAHCAGRDTWQLTADANQKIIDQLYKELYDKITTT